MNAAQNVVPIFQMNENLAAEAGISEFVVNGGAYNCTILKAKFIKAKSTGSDGLEISVITDSELKANYLNIYFRKNNGESIKSGEAMLSGIMYLTGIPALTSTQQNGEFFALELEGQNLGLFLQKSFYKKTGGGEGANFDIAMPFQTGSLLTPEEAMQGKAAETIKKMIADYRDK
ncbi:phage-related protein [Oleispira antarctica RB-8]|uniref:Phage-related protein n=1 Tax=Oleispira antarctica RB-8 TaxID=698738 RepID=R4YKQ0_OLEAN|nr:phage-related protein [Oleispira antarctica RB-8]